VTGWRYFPQVGAYFRLDERGELQAAPEQDDGSILGPPDEDAAVEVARLFSASRRESLIAEHLRALEAAPSCPRCRARWLESPVWASFQPHPAHLRAGATGASGFVTGLLCPVVDWVDGEPPEWIR
jgi:hypothetical protein